MEHIIYLGVISIIMVILNTASCSVASVKQKIGLKLSLSVLITGIGAFITVLFMVGLLWNLHFAVYILGLGVMYLILTAVILGRSVWEVVK